MAQPECVQYRPAVGYHRPKTMSQWPVARGRVSVFQPSGLRQATCHLMLLLVGLMSAPTVSAQDERPRLALVRGDRLVLIGNTLAERMQHFNHFEALLMTQFPDLDLSVRNLGWSADTLTLQPRPLNFGDMRQHVMNQKPSVVLAFFGMNESFEGAAGLAAFERDLAAFITSYKAAATSPRLVLVSPIAHERLPHLTEIDVDARNVELARYTDAMRGVAAAKAVLFVDLLTPSQLAMATSTRPLTINGIHLNEHGDQVVGTLLLRGLGIEAPKIPASGRLHDQYEALREAIGAKNLQFFLRWRPVNAEYVVGRRVEPFGSVNFPGEMRTLDRMVDDLDKVVWQKARALPASGLSITISQPARGRER